MNKINILVVDDEKEIRDLIEIYLRNEGYGIFLAEDGISSLKILKCNYYQELVAIGIFQIDMNRSYSLL
ncbi:hypothetical protein ACTQ4K_16425 [Clostridium sporogenes]|uniref:hypothetical protein n=1 Tax=Clostridium sporogenes TaxID=1509 RepID=UPI003F8EACF3